MMYYRPITVFLVQKALDLPGLDLPGLPYNFPIPKRPGKSRVNIMYLYPNKLIHVI